MNKKVLLLLLLALANGILIIISFQFLLATLPPMGASHPASTTTVVSYSPDGTFVRLDSSLQGEPITRTTVLTDDGTVVDIYRNGKPVERLEYYPGQNGARGPIRRKAQFYFNKPTTVVGSLIREEVWCENGNICKTGRRRSDLSWEEREFDPSTGVTIVHRVFDSGYARSLRFENRYRVDGTAIYRATMNDMELLVRYYDETGRGVISETVETSEGLVSVIKYQQGRVTEKHERQGYSVVVQIYWPGTTLLLKDKYLIGSSGQLEHTSYTEDGKPVMRRRWVKAYDPGKSSQILVPYGMQLYGPDGGWYKAYLWSQKGDFVQAEIIPVQPVPENESVKARIEIKYSSAGAVESITIFDWNGDEILADSSLDLSASAPRLSDMDSIPQVESPVKPLSSVNYSHSGPGSMESDYSVEHSSIYSQIGPP